MYVYVCMYVCGMYVCMYVCMTDCCLCLFASETSGGSGVYRPLSQGCRYVPTGGSKVTNNV